MTAHRCPVSRSLCRVGGVRRGLIIVVLLVTLTGGALLAQNPLSVSKPEADNSPAAELASFVVDESLDLEVGLYADESLGIANPVCCRWDASGRLWVLCTWAYPQIRPDEPPDDKLIILEDTDSDGKADKSSVFAGGLDMPTGFAFGHNGVYLGEGHDLIHLSDTDGDGKADNRRLIFTGFGTGDTHQNINSFTWSPGGELYFGQGLHCFSHVQTPWGNRHLEEHGSWRLRPLRRQLNSYRRTSGGGNPWGYAFGDWGEPFIKSNRTTVSELLPALVQTDHYGGGYWGGSMEIGGTKIKSMIIEIIDSPALPDSLQGDFLIAGYFARNIARLRPSVDGAGHRLERLEPMLVSSYNAFRPVDINTGPDGALYVADWFNPIIGHYQASFRHPDRDLKHGRIWRITGRERPTLKALNLAAMSADQLCRQLASSTRSVRQLAKLRLMDLPKAEAVAATQRWIDGLDPSAAGYEHSLYEAVGVFESHEAVNPALLDRLLAAEDYRARAYGIRVAGRWRDRLDDPLKRLRIGARDPEPRVRLETIVAAAEVPDPESIVIACRAADDSADRFINYALTQAVHGLADQWKPLLIEKRLAFDRPSHLVRVLATYGGEELLDVVRDNTSDPAMLTVLASIGNAADAVTSLRQGARRPEVLQALARSARERALKPPAGAMKLLKEALADPANPGRRDAVELCAEWNLRPLTEAIAGIALDAGEDAPVRVTAVRAMARLGGPGVNRTLMELAGGTDAPELGVAAIGGLALRDVSVVAEKAVALLPGLSDPGIAAVLTALLDRVDGAEALTRALGRKAVPADTAKLMRRWMNGAGRFDERLAGALDAIIGRESTIPEFSPGLVAQLSRDALAKGDAINGRRVFQLPLASCVACHDVDGIPGAVGGVKGPNLSAVAAGLPIELLVESVLWPARQIKEGYQATTITTKDGRVVTGFKDGERGGLIRVRDIATGAVTVVRRGQVKQESKNGSMMPQGLTAGLTRQELLDLLKFLSTLKSSAPD